MANERKKSKPNKNGASQEFPELESHPRQTPKSSSGFKAETLETLAGSQRKKNQEFFIPVHGFIALTPEELQIVNHPSFQRLGRVFQLGQSHLLFRGATHMRFEHALGVVEVAQQIIDATKANSDKPSGSSGPSLRCPLAPNLEDHEKKFIRLAALLHDIGHLPAGHTLEDELGILNKHDSVARVQLVLSMTDFDTFESLESFPEDDADPEQATDQVDSSTETSLGALINELYDPVLAGVPTPVGFNNAVDVLLAIICNSREDSENPRPETSLRIDVYRDIVGNTICADLLDYLHRDWYHVGKPKYYERRLFQYMELRSNKDGISQFVISLGSRPRIRTDAVSNILDLLESRYQLAEAVLFHHTKCAAAAMLERGLTEYVEENHLSSEDQHQKELERLFLMCTDDTLVTTLVETSQPDKPSHVILSKLRRRHIYRDAHTLFWSDLLRNEHRERARSLYAPKKGNIDESRKAATNRLKAARLLEKDFDLDEGSIAIYCPESDMNSKIAKVKICLDDSIMTLSEWEEKYGQMLTGGHLEAQKHRFERLWRIHFFLCRDTFRKLEETDDMRLLFLPQAIEYLVLGITPPGIKGFNAAWVVAKQLKDIATSQFFKRDVEGARLAAIARARDGSPAEFSDYYPTEIPTIASFMEDR